jgi:hypothetical protein
MRRLAVLVVLSGMMALFGNVVSASPAGATPPERQSFQDSFSFVDNSSCSFRIHVSIQFQERVTRFFDQQGNTVRRNDHIASQGTWTNRASGESLIESETWNVPFDPETETARVLGLNWHFKLPSGRTVVIDAGKLVFDADGNVIFEAGNHQMVDSDFAVLCPFLS